MEMREWATRILSADTLSEKLLDPGVLTDHTPGPAIVWKEPTRPVGMGFQKHSRKNRLPPLHDHKDPYKRGVCLHRFAGHELLAVEIMAYALLAFPEAPVHFRRGLAHTLKEEQGHVKLYIERMSAFGLQFGDLPLYRHFWAYVPHLTNPLRYVAVMSLTFEMANLDFAPIYRSSFLKYGDQDSAALMQTILKDEIGHVSFGYRWLQKWKENEKSEWETWVANLPPLALPSRAKSAPFYPEHRRMAGVPEEWIINLQNS
jgi:uncharacterized ferritin-like protein (DUF455 family)